MAKSVRKAWKVALLSFEISVLIEVSQLIFQVGCFDVDDMILNTLGGLLGYLLFRAAYSVYLCIETRHKARTV
jgi:glycopeptide antibiotics resistance protein